MKPRNDFMDPERNKKKEKFPLGQHKPIFIIGMDKDSKEIYNEYAQHEDELKEILASFKKKCDKGSIKLFGIWAGRFKTLIFDITGIY